MNAKSVLLAVLFALGLSQCTAKAATVSFLGSFDVGASGPVLGSVPRNFILTLDYTPVPTATSLTTGTFTFPLTPNGQVMNPNSHPLVIVPTTGSVTVADNTATGGLDAVSFEGSVASPFLGPNNVNYAFSFINPSDTISSGGVTEANVNTLVIGEVEIFFAGGAIGPSGRGMIQGAPEPSTMLALTGMVMGCCGIGYRRRKLNASEEETEPEAA